LLTGKALFEAAPQLLALGVAQANQLLVYRIFLVSVDP
jgi:hypothetical protein